VNSGFLKSFNGRRLCVGQAWFGIALGKNPLPAACAHQQKFDILPAMAVTDSGDLFTFGQFPQMSYGNELSMQFTVGRPPWNA
jgi:hypothetical protein